MLFTHRQIRYARLSTGLIAGAVVQTACGSSMPPSRPTCGGDEPADSPELAASGDPIVAPLESEPVVRPLIAEPGDAGADARPVELEVEKTEPPRRSPRIEPEPGPPAPASEPVLKSAPEPEEKAEPEPDIIAGASRTIEPPPPSEPDPVARSYVELPVRAGIWAPSY